jgi:type I restriction enzyme S subunit
VSESGNERSVLPEGWVSAQLDVVADINPPLAAPVTAELPISFVPMPAVEEETGRLDSTNIRKFAEVSKGYTRFQDGDLLFAKITPCMENGKVAIARNLKNGIGCGSTEFHVLRPRDSIDQRYLFYFLVQKRFRQEAEHKMTGSAGQKRVPVGFMQSASIPIPPPAEQTRIADKIDELFSAIEEGEGGLRKVQALLKKQRQAVLKAAVTGELTHDWRERHGATSETGADLLKRILAARRAAWEADQQAKAKSAGKVLKGEAWKSKYKMPVPPAEVPEDLQLPKSWCWVSPAQISPPVDYATAIGPFGSSLKVSDYRSTGTPLVFVRHIRGRNFRGLSPQFVSRDKARELKAHEVVEGDVLITKMGEPPGDAAVYPHTERGIITADCIKWTPLTPFARAKFLEFYINSQLGRDQFVGITQGVAQKKVSLERFRSISIALPPLAEQDAIIDRAEEGLSKVDAMEAAVLAELKRSSRLRQAVLKAAFSGKLVSRNINDESADALLERFSAARAGGVPARNHFAPLRRRRARATGQQMKAKKAKQA